MHDGGFGSTVLTEPFLAYPELWAMIPCCFPACGLLRLFSSINSISRLSNLCIDLSSLLLNACPCRHFETAPFFFLIFFFIFEREREERERASMSRRGTEREGDTGCQQAVCWQDWAQCGAQTHELWDYDLSWSQMLNRLSHPGAPRDVYSLAVGYIFTEI